MQYDWIDWLNGGNSSGAAIELDSAGNVYAGINFSGTLTFGTDEFTSRGENDMFIAKLNSNGEILWGLSVGGPGNDVVNRLAISASGALFLCGGISTNVVFGSNGPLPANSLIRAFVARVDNGNLTWIDAFSDENSAEGITISLKDQSIWALGGTGYRMFIKAYQQDGTVLTNFNVGEDSRVFPSEIAVARNGNIFVTGTFSGGDYNPLRLGTTNIRANFSAQFTAAMDSTGRVFWAWSADTGWPSYGNAIALARDGSVISAGQVQRTANGGSDYAYAFASKQTPDGRLMWLTALGEHRGSYSARDVAVDARGNVLLAGHAHGYYFDPASRLGVLLAGFDASGNKLFNHHIKSAGVFEDNRGGAIACNSVGDIYFTGYLTGTPTFGTNTLESRPATPANAFIARRATLQPVLATGLAGTNLVLTWPRTALPFALQQNPNALADTWTNASPLPTQTNDKNHVIVPALEPQQFFRLMDPN